LSLIENPIHYQLYHIISYILPRFAFDMSIDKIIDSRWQHWRKEVPTRDFIRTASKAILKIIFCSKNVSTKTEVNAIFTAANKISSFHPSYLQLLLNRAFFMLDIISCRVMISLENLLWLYCSAWQQNAINFGQSSSGRLLLSKMIPFKILFYYISLPNNEIFPSINKYPTRMIIKFIWLWVIQLTNKSWVSS